MCTEYPGKGVLPVSLSRPGKLWRLLSVKCHKAFEWGTQLPMCSAWVPWSDKPTVVFSNEPGWELDFLPGIKGRSKL